MRSSAIGPRVRFSPQDRTWQYVVLFREESTARRKTHSFDIDIAHCGVCKVHLLVHIFYIYGITESRNSGVGRRSGSLAMAAVEFEEGGLSKDAAVIGRRLSVEPSLVQLRMREGKITVLCEPKVYKDAGRHRLSLLYENRRFSPHCPRQEMPSNLQR